MFVTPAFHVISPIRSPGIIPVPLTRFVGPDGTEPVVIGREVEIKLSAQEQTATSVEIFMNPVFKVPGVHWVEILLEGQLRLRYPLMIAPPTPAAQ
mgnify:CR=1 FL=1